MYPYGSEQIETGEIDASIDAHGSVTFADDEPAVVPKAEIDRALRVAQEQERVLRKLEREIARNKEYLHKVRVLLFASSVRAGRLTLHDVFRQCEAERKHRTRPRIGRTLKKSCWRAVVGLKSPCFESDRVCCKKRDVP
jgi:hypothetical protein